MKPFDLEKALAGEPVKLENGLKAYITGKVKDEYNTKYCLVGYVVSGDVDVTLESWDITGSAGLNLKYREQSIAGMWEEPKPKKFINGIEVPESVTLETYEPNKFYWFVDFSETDNVAYSKLEVAFEEDRNIIKTGLVFETKEGAAAMAKALLNYKVGITNDK